LLFVIDLHTQRWADGEGFSPSVRLNPEPQIMNTTTRTPVLTFAFSCALSIVFWWRPLGTTLRLALTNDAYTHIL
jgi:hypothetical protein